MPILKTTFSLILLSLIGCSTVQPSHKNKDWLGYSESGIASYYADKHQYQKTASGEPYRHTLKTAAHKTLPFGVNVKVTNLENSKSVIVKVNDRGPFVKGRIIDLSKSAFMAISQPNQGLLKVRIEVVP
ncbi:septal ring lytic transglycosylase RlpA family protein [Moraxellaceae bacterium AER2_44_116]|nr:septal ring lytic transglycosylase RlpA family protein [Moraxellaceae bacterium]TQC98514.1 septal ring lytic transglycosylase RlpA family protein [Moraxellaceae bacterium AER2_44_116]